MASSALGSPVLRLLSVGKIVSQDVNVWLWTLWANLVLELLVLSMLIIAKGQTGTL